MTKAKMNSCSFNCITAGFPSLRWFMLFASLLCFGLTIGTAQPNGNEHWTLEFVGTAQASEVNPWGQKTPTC